MPRLENWTLINRFDEYGNPYQKLVGTVYGHPCAYPPTGELCDGTRAITSKIVNLDLDKGIAITKTGHVYELMTKNPEDMRDVYDMYW